MTIWINKMKVLFLLLVIVSFFCCSSKEKEQEKMKISGHQAEVLYVAIKDFYIYDWPIERYEIEINEDDAFYIVKFIPEIPDYETAYYGEQDFGNSVDYWISKRTHEIEKKIFGR